MIKSILIRRANVCSSICEPLKWSENQQLAINNGIQLTILDPKLPSIHQSVNSANFDSGESEVKILDSKKLYEICTILDQESTEKLNVGALQNFVITTLNEKFNFGRINEPTITSHSWSPVNNETRDCYLAVLFNTSELLIMKRSSIMTGDYEERVNVLVELLLQLKISQQDITTHEISVSNKEFLQFKVYSFQFNKLTSNGLILLALGLADGSISVHFLKNGLEIKAKSISESPVIKMCWSSWFEDDSEFISYLTTASCDNSCNIYEIRINSKNDVFILKLKELQSASRFQVSYIRSFEDAGKAYFFIASTSSLGVHQVSKRGEIRSRRLELSCASLVTGIVLFKNTNETVEINLSFENGKFILICMRVDSFDFKTGQTHQILLNFTARALYKFQLTNSRDSENDTVQDISGLTRPYLNDIVEGNFVNHGFEVSRNGILVLANSIYPKDVLNYTILSKSSFDVSFIPLKSIYNSFEQDECTGTSLSFLNCFCFNNYTIIPLFPSSNNDQKELEVTNFFKQLEDFKREKVQNISDINLTLHNAYSFEELLRLNLLENSSIRKLQYIYNFNLAIKKSMKVLNSQRNAFAPMKEYSHVVDGEQRIIEDMIFKQLSSCVLRFVADSKISLEDEFDKFIVLSYYLLQLNSTNYGLIHSESLIEIQTRFVTETFVLRADEAIKENTRELITSVSGHKWSRCALTLLPMLDTRNKTDELRHFYYSTYQGGEKSWVLKGLMKELDFCIFTGNKKLNTYTL